jgi:uncharacterized protein (DUF885 family)
MNSPQFFRNVALSAVLTMNLTAATPPVEPGETESARANAFFDRVFDETVDRSPILQGHLGLKKDQDKWDDFSEQRQAEDLALTAQHLAELKRDIHFDALDEQTKLSYRLFVSQSEQAIEGWRWRHHAYVFTQMAGWHSDAPAFLINYHLVENAADARAYIARLRALPRMFDQLEENAKTAAALGILPPKFVFPLLIGASREVLTGEPFDRSGTRNAMLEDFETKVGALKDVDAATRQQLVADARAALLDSVKPAYDKLIALFEEQEKTATDDDGVWKLPQGAEYYDFQLRVNTTTTLTADEIHELGLREVARIQKEMMAIKDRLGFKGDLKAFFDFTRRDPQFSYPNTEEGREAYMKRATAIIDEMRGRLDEFFRTKPKAPLIVKRVEPFREKGAAAAFYEQPSADGTRPGIYFVNTIDMKGLPIWEMETLAHHEAIPGHHMQIAISQELQNMPKFRKYSDGYTAYVEGWAVYAEYFPKEYGFYRDPYMDFGRLADELLRAARLVVDTGLHAKKWTHQQVVDYMLANTPDSDRDIYTESNRYVVWPGQATAYKIGMLKILELRELAKKELGPKFDIRDYHDLVLRNGALPLDLLEENVRAWIAQKKSS